MSVLSGDMEPKRPQWIDEHRDMLGRLGFTWDVSGDSGDEYARQVDEAGLEYLKLQIEDPDKAIEAVPDYLRRFGSINRGINILSRLLPEQFGLIINIAALRYDPDNNEDRAYALYYQINDYLAGENSMDIGGYTAELRNPKLLRDLVAHWGAVNWPYTGQYARFLEGNTDWESISEHIALNRNNPLMFAVTVPRASTNPLVQARFRETYPELSQEGIDIIAAGLFNRGAHNEHLIEAYPERAARHSGWEGTIYEMLESYGEGYKADILAAITRAKWHVFNEQGFNFPGLPEKLLHTAFSLDTDGRLERVSR